ncbi:hypothetical protein CIB48_g3692 [Xylaria polymorpha]|nr:hypothetical protein CIB48_g3692 [Xylaria polymorpha]
MKPISYWPALLYLAPRVSGLSGWPNGGTIVAGNAVLFDRDSWEANLARPNATGNNSVVGFDVSKPWPSAQIDGWHLSINVTSDIPDSQTMNPSNATGKTFTGTSIFLQAPDNLRATFSDQNALDETTWKICIIAYAEKFPRNQDCYGTPPSTPSSCGDALNTGSFNVQQLALDSISGKEVFVTASDPHDPNDEKSMTEATEKMWPVLTIWGWNARANASDDASPTVQLSCISARDVEPGSQSPPSAGSRHCGSAVAAFVVACIAAYTLL